MSKTRRYTSDNVDKLRGKYNKRKYDATIARFILEQAIEETDTPQTQFHATKFIKEKTAKR